VKELTPEGFESILAELCAKLTAESRTGGKFAKSTQFETRVREVLQRLVSPYGLAVDFDPHPYVFPDIVLGIFGVEVKFTTGDTWRSVAIVFLKALAARPWNIFTSSSVRWEVSLR